MTFPWSGRRFSVGKEAIQAILESQKQDWESTIDLKDQYHFEIEIVEADTHRVVAKSHKHFKSYPKARGVALDLIHDKIVLDLDPAMSRDYRLDKLRLEPNIVMVIDLEGIDGLE